MFNVCGMHIDYDSSNLTQNNYSGSCRTRLQMIELDSGLKKCYAELTFSLHRHVGRHSNVYDVYDIDNIKQPIDIIVLW